MTNAITNDDVKSVNLVEQAAESFVAEELRFTADEGYREFEPGRCPDCDAPNDGPNRRFSVERCPDCRRRYAPECEGLSPLVRGIVNGYEYKIHGNGAELMNLRPTRTELIVLASHYLKQHFRIRESLERQRSGEAWGRRVLAFTARRFLSIAKTLNPDAPMEAFQGEIKRRTARIEEVRVEVERFEEERNSLPF